MESTGVRGKVVGKRHCLEEFIGKGGTGIVYRASLVGGAGGPLWMTPVALRLTETDNLFGLRALVQRSSRAFRRLSLVRSPRILRLIEGGLDEDGSFYLVTEFLDPASSLRNLLDQHEHGLPLERALRIAHELCAALADVQALSIVHGTLKPSKIYLRQENGHESVVVSGWDFATTLVSDADDVEIDVTTPGPCFVLRYASPEQVEHKSIDGRSDLFAVGVILFEMLTGTKRLMALTGKMKDLWRERSDGVASDEAWKERFSATSLAEPIVDVLSRLLASEAADRFATPEIACDALKQVLGDVHSDSEAPDVTRPGSVEFTDFPSTNEGDPGGHRRDRGWTIDRDLLNQMASGTGDRPARFVEYVEAALNSGIPDGWRWSRTGSWAYKDYEDWVSRDLLNWWIGKSDDYDNVAYEVSYVWAMGAFVILYGNGGGGIGPSGFQNAMILPLFALFHCGMDRWVANLVRSFPPNVGYDWT